MNRHESFDPFLIGTAALFYEESTMLTVEYIPAEWLERSAWAASYGEALICYSRPIEIERRQTVRRTADRAVESFKSLLS